jgi:FPC/CPF motif-containing protein YcgG
MPGLLHRPVDGALRDERGEATAPAWGVEAYRRVRAMLLASGSLFPCYLGTVAEEKGLLRYAFVEPEEAEAPTALRDALALFLADCDALPGRSALLAFVGRKVEGATLAEYEARFWRTLQFLHDHDPAPWSADIPTDPAAPRWEFCFGGRPLFISGHSPLHVRRRSRHSPEGLMLVIQTRDNLKDLVGHDAKGESVKGRIRGLLAKYDAAAVSPTLATYGDPGALEWRQYWFDDSDTPATPARCPLRIRELG